MTPARQELVLSITQGCVWQSCTSYLQEVDLIDLAIVAVLCYRLLRSAASGIVELELVAELSCSLGSAA